jgi:hypothetical protein
MTVRAVYIDGHNSIVKNLPIPLVGVCNKVAYILAREIINHLLAIGIDVFFFMQGMKLTGLTNQAILQQIFSMIFIKNGHVSNHHESVVRWIRGSSDQSKK